MRERLALLPLPQKQPTLICFLNFSLPLNIAKSLLNLQYLHFIFFSIFFLKMLAVSLSHSIKQKPVNSTARKPEATGAHLCSDKVGLLLAIGERLTMRKDGEAQ